jgi:hypothetical protein
LLTAAVVLVAGASAAVAAAAGIERLSHHLLSPDRHRGQQHFQNFVLIRARFLDFN